MTGQSSRERWKTIKQSVNTGFSVTSLFSNLRLSVGFNRRLTVISTTAVNIKGVLN